MLYIAQAIFCVIYVVIVYLLTSQPAEWFRFAMFLTSCLLISFVAQSVGLVVGAAMNVQVSHCSFIYKKIFLIIKKKYISRKWAINLYIVTPLRRPRLSVPQNGVFLAPVMSVPFLLFSGFFVSFNAIPVYLRWITYLSYIRYGFEGTALATYSFDRKKLECHQVRYILNMFVSLCWGVKNMEYQHPYSSLRRSWLRAQTSQKKYC